MTFNAHSVLILVATIIFGVEFGLLVAGTPDGKLLWELLSLGLAFFSAGHVI